MNKEKRAKLSVCFIRIFYVLVCGLALFVSLPKGCVQEHIKTLIFVLVAFVAVVFGHIGIVLSVCPRCGKTNKDRFYGFIRILPTIEIALSGELPLCKKCLAEQSRCCGCAARR